MIHIIYVPDGRVLEQRRSCIAPGTVVSQQWLQDGESRKKQT
jgi:hypothetical protein